MIYEIVTVNGTLHIESTPKQAVKRILAALKLDPSALILDETDWRGHDFFKGRDVFLASRLIKESLDCTGDSVYWDNYRDITELISSGQWITHRGHAICLPRMPKVRSRIKRMKPIRNLLVITKLKRLEALGASDSS